LNKIVFPAAVIGIIISSIDFILPEIELFSNLIFIPDSAIISGIIGGATGFTLFLITKLIYPPGMGWGDVKLAGLIGLVISFPMVFAALFIGIIIGGITALILLVFKIKGRKEGIPYGSFLALGPIATLLWGGDILNWYLALF